MLHSVRWLYGAAHALCDERVTLRRALYVSACDERVCVCAVPPCVFDGVVSPVK